MNHVVLANPVTLLSRLAILAVLAAGIVAGCYLFLHGFTLLQRKRLMANTPRSTIRSAAIGLVEVSGRAAGPYTLISPLSQSECFYYRAVAWQAKDEEKRWRKAADEKLYAPFFVEDETGAGMVDPRAAEINLPPTFSQELMSGDVLEYMLHFLNRHGISTEFPIKLEEHCICPGDTLFVLGTLKEKAEGGNTGDLSAHAYRHAEPEPMSEGAADLQRQGALEALHISQADLAKRRPRPQPAGNFDLHPPAVLAKGGNDPFILSNRSQREVILEMAWKSVLYIWGGPILALACLWVLLTRMVVP
jgi:E3 Ubiquitin ligase